VVVDDTGLFNEKLKEWGEFDDFHRPHGGLGGKLPTNGYVRRPELPCNRPSSVAHLVSAI